MREIESERQFEEWLDESRSPEAAAVQGLDVRNFEVKILNGTFDGSLFIACTATPESVAHLLATGAQVVPSLSGFVFKQHLSSLYTPQEIFAGFDVSDENGYKKTFDYKVYDEYVKQGKASPTNIRVSLARRMHDHSITDALQEELEGEKVVAVMGGHGMERADEFYFRVASLSRRLTRDGYLMVSGGGPGAMEATHLGAYFATRSEQDLADAVDEIKIRPDGAEPGREYKDKDWLHRAWQVTAKYPLSDSDRLLCRSVGIPTWLYGHEPPSNFATKIAKYFANSVREDGLLMVASHGVIFAPGKAGTTQDIFQDAAQNHYATSGYYSPMILFGREYWTTNRPVWPLLHEVSRRKTYGELVELTDSADTIIRRIKSYDPSIYKA